MWTSNPSSPTLCHSCSGTEENTALNQRNETQMHGPLSTRKHTEATSLKILHDYHTDSRTFWLAARGSRHDSVAPAAPCMAAGSGYGHRYVYVYTYNKTIIRGSGCCATRYVNEESSRETHSPLVFAHVYSFIGTHSLIHRTAALPSTSTELNAARADCRDGSRATRCEQSPSAPRLPAAAHRPGGRCSGGARFRLLARRAERRQQRLPAFAKTILAGYRHADSGGGGRLPAFERSVGRNEGQYKLYVKLAK